MYYKHNRLPRKLKKVLKKKYPQLFCRNHEFYREFLDLNQKLWYVLSIEKPLLHQKIMNEIIKDNGFNNSLNRVSKIMVKNNYDVIDFDNELFCDYVKDVMVGWLTKQETINNDEKNIQSVTKNGIYDSFNVSSKLYYLEMIYTDGKN